METGSWTDQAKAVLRDEGYRAGGARTAVVELLGAEGGCLDADSVADRLRERRRGVGTASVYRALGLLVDLGLLDRVPVGEGGHRYELVHPSGEHHHHFLCESCGRTVNFADAELETALHSVEERLDHRIDSHEVTLRGRCDRCGAGSGS